MHLQRNDVSCRLRVFLLFNGAQRSCMMIDLRCAEMIYCVSLVESKNYCPAHSKKIDQWLLKKNGNKVISNIIE